VFFEKHGEDFIQGLERNGMSLLSTLNADLPLCTPFERASLIVSMLGYRYPKLRSVEFKAGQSLDGLSDDEKIKTLEDAVAFLRGQKGDGA